VPETNHLTLALQVSESRGFFSQKKTSDRLKAPENQGDESNSKDLILFKFFTPLCASVVQNRSRQITKITGFSRL
jgi:hypothetical protein